MLHVNYLFAGLLMVSGLFLCGGLCASTPTQDFIARVNEHTLMRSELDQKVSLALRYARARVPTNDLEKVRKNLSFQFTQMFVHKKVLLDEASHLKVELTHEERATNTVALLARNNRGGAHFKSLEELLARHPLGAAFGRQEVEEDWVIQKLLKKQVLEPLSQTHMPPHQAASKPFTPAQARAEEKRALQTYVRACMRKAKIDSPVYPQLLPREPAKTPLKVIESAPVELKLPPRKQ